MRFALYQSDGLIPGLIRRFTRSRYSHVAIDFGEIIYESIASGFVRAGSYGENHAPGTTVDLFGYNHPLTRNEEAAARDFCRSIVGTAYDYDSVFVHFPLRLAGDGNRGKWFCSEAALAASWSMGEHRLLQRMLPERCMPDHIAISPLLRWEGSVILKSEP